MAEVTEEKSLGKVWLVLAIILVLFIVAFFLDQIIATAIPSYTGFFELNLFSEPAITP